MPEANKKVQEMFDVVNTELTANLQSYMDSLPVLAARYGRFLEVTKTLNPKSEKRVESSAPLSPLLKRKGSNGFPLEREKSPLTDTPNKAVLAVPPEELLEVAAAEMRANPETMEFFNSFDGVTTSEKLPDIPEDPNLITNMEALSTEAYELRVLLSGICDWIEMQMPAIKDEDNRGVAVQEAVIRHLVHMRGSVQSVNDRQRVYSERLAEYASKYFKAPRAAKQWAKLIIILQHDQWDQLERDWRELRQLVILSGRLLSINMDKLTIPRDSGHSRMNYM
eukprot:TRINITY_DN13299_c0_g3_i2.p1 TRINITY_DN13299_c0_g3~~TRINITY_DN13299_c0_g3_i2.p1  ORF type:complete len:324 (+),score=64.99 TRINITY_DN13299_c0_g3_i2:133-972(+)